MPAVLLTEPKIRFFDNNGLPLAGGLLYSYVAGTVSTNKATYTAADMLTQNTNPIVLDSAGYANVWISGSYKFVLTDSLGNQIWSEDNITSFSTGATGSTFLDGSFFVQNTSDPTKQLKFDLSNLPTGTTISLQPPTSNGQIALTTNIIGVAGSTRNAKMSISTASASATFTADEIVTETGLGGTPYRLSNYSQSINLATTGAGGMDIASAPTSGFVSYYAINKADGSKGILAAGKTYSATTTSGTPTLSAITSTAGSYVGDAVQGTGIPNGTTILSLTATSITMSANASASATVTINTYPVTTIYSGVLPSGYVASAFLGTWITNGSQQFTQGAQIERRIYNVKSQILSTASPVATYTLLSASSVVPVNAKNIYGSGGSVSNTNTAIAISSDANGTGEQVILAPTTTAGASIAGYAVGLTAMQYGPIPMITPQTIYYKAGNTSLSTKIDVTSYDI